MSCHVRALDEMNSGQVVLFKGGHIKFVNFLLPRCLVHICATCFQFSPLCLYLVGCTVSRRVRALNETHSGRVVSLEGGHIKFSKL